MAGIALPYGEVNVLPFKITLSGVGVDLTVDSTLLDADVRAVKLLRDGTWSSRTVDVSVELTKADGTNMPGLWHWTPANASDTQGAWYGLYIKDAAGSAFDENLVLWGTGGNSNALLRKT